MNRSIPKRLLIHTIGYQQFKEEGSMGPLYESEETIENVLVQLKTELVIGSNGEEVQAKGVIYLDPVNTPKYKPLREKSIILFKGDNYMVLGCEPLYTLDSETPHHTKVVII